MHKRGYQQERGFPGMPEDDRGGGGVKEQDTEVRKTNSCAKTSNNQAFTTVVCTSSYLSTVVFLKIKNIPGISQTYSLKQIHQLKTKVEGYLTASNKSTKKKEVSHNDYQLPVQEQSLINYLILKIAQGHSVILDQ